jgi:hypothetical protein
MRAIFAAVRSRDAWMTETLESTPNGADRPAPFLN